MARERHESRDITPRSPLRRSERHEPRHMASRSGPRPPAVDDAFPRPAELPADHSNTTELGILLFTEYVYPFELAAIILLVAIVAAIALTLRKRPNTRHQDPSRQVRVKRGDRVRLVSMPSEKRPGADQ